MHQAGKKGQFNCPIRGQTPVHMSFASVWAHKAWPNKVAVMWYRVGKVSCRLPQEPEALGSVRQRQHGQEVCPNPWRHRHLMWPKTNPGMKASRMQSDRRWVGIQGPSHTAMTKAGYEHE